MPSITTAVCNSFKKELLKGEHDLETDVLKIALIADGYTGDYGASTTNYSDLTGNSDEVSGGNYVAGKTLDMTGTNVVLDGSTAYVDFPNVDFGTITASADGCLIYNSTNGGAGANAAVAVFAFDSTVTSTNGTFTVEFPAPGASTAVLRIS